MGSITDVRFQNITARTEAGIVISGCPQSTIEGVVLDTVQLDFVHQTDFPGGFMDYRPDQRDLVYDVATSALFVEHANHITLNNVEVRTQPIWPLTMVFPFLCCSHM